METLASIRCSLTPGRWADSIELKDVFFHVPTTEATNRSYASALDITFSTSGHFHLVWPLPFTCWLDWSRQWPRLPEHRAFPFSSAWMIETSWPHLQQPVELGLPGSSTLLNTWVLSSTLPSPPPFVDISFDLTDDAARPVQHGVQNLLSTLQTFSSSWATPVHRRQQLLGHLTSPEKLTTGGFLHVRHLRFALHNSWSLSSDLPFQPVIIPQEALPALHWWSQLDSLTRGVPLCPPPSSVSQLQLFINALTERWEGVVTSAFTRHPDCGMLSRGCFT